MIIKRSNLEDKTYLVIDDFGDMRSLIRNMLLSCGAGDIEVAAFGQQRGDTDCAIVFDEAIGWVVRHNRAEVMIKASRDRAFPDRLCEVDIAQRVFDTSHRRFAIFGDIVLTQMPFADACRFIVVFLKQLADG